MLTIAPAGHTAEPESVFPSRTVRLVVAFPAGGTADVLARIIGQKLSEKWAQPVIVENRVGAGGNIGAASVYTAEPDGHTILMTAPGPLAINQNLYRSLPFEPSRFLPISVVAAIPNAVTVRSDLPIRSLGELINYGKANPGKLVYVSAGNGSTQHLSGQMLATLGNIEMVHVPYKGEGAALNDLLAGRVDVFVGNISALLKFQQTGKIRLLALASSRRSTLVPELPTTAEAGLPKLVGSSWFALAAPPGTPAARVQSLYSDVQQILKLSDVKENFRAQGAEVVGLSPRDSTDYIDADRTRWKQVIETANVRLD